MKNLDQDLNLVIARIFHWPAITLEAFNLFLNLQAEVLVS